ncbi:MAG: hypothetical protein SH859_03755 [Hyphomicrobium aestuarii]|nr:hypothetical protein [Hyphomicrobium aestuarii]
MLVSDLLKQLSDEDKAAAALLDLGDIVLIGQVRDAGRHHGESVGEYVYGATRRFASQALDEDWLRLSTALQKSETPAATCLQAMVTWAVANDRSEGAHHQGCSCKS